MKYRLLLGAILALNIPVSGVFAGQNNDLFVDAHLRKVNPLEDKLLDTYRGGFSFGDNYVVNIGLSITTAIDGNVMFRSKIADMIIENGSLTYKNTTVDDTVASGTEDNAGLLNVVQVGSGNNVEVEGTTPSPTTSVANASNITNIIQNTLDNRVIGLNTVVDVNAEVADALKQARVAKQLEDAVLSRFY